MKSKRLYLFLLAALFVAAVAVRLWLAFQSPHFCLEDAYFTYRQVDSISSSFVPSYVDDLSYSGRTHIFPPLYYYLLSFFSFFMGVSLALKVIPNIFACTLIVIVYFMVLDMTKNRNIALFSSAAAAFIPVFFANTVNSASVISFTLPLMFYLVYCFMRIKERRFLYRFLFFSFIISLTSALSFLFVFAMLLYLLLTRLEYKVQNRIELEVILFVTFLTIWINAIMYKDAFLFHSYSLIWQNIPSQVLSAYFKDVDIVASVTNIGLLPLLLGVYAVYRYMFKERDKRTYLLMAFALAVAFLLWFKLVTLEVGLMFLGAILIPLLAQSLNILFRYASMTKVASYGWALWVPLVALLILTSVVPSFVKASVEMTHALSEEEAEALYWLGENSPDDAVVLSTIDEGSVVSAIADRRNVADDDFILIRSSDEVFEDVETMYTSILKTRAVELMDKYGVDYVYFSPRAEDEFGIDTLRYAEEDCFVLVYDRTVQIYERLCRIKV